MTHTHAKPLIMGAAMGAMMLWMLHGFLTGDAELSHYGALAFLGAHVAAIGGIALLTVLGAKRNERVAALMGKLHRPTLGHTGAMLISAFSIALLIHLIHGAP
ncbi:MAG: hypothetical protein AAF891_03830 [Pseudomonadota bacterium]